MENNLKYCIQFEWEFNTPTKAVPNDYSVIKEVEVFNAELNREWIKVAASMYTPKDQSLTLIQIYNKFRYFINKFNFLKKNVNILNCKLVSYKFYGDLLK